MREKIRQSGTNYVRVWAGRGRGKEGDCERRRKRRHGQRDKPDSSAEERRKEMLRVEAATDRRVEVLSAPLSRLAPPFFYTPYLAPPGMKATNKGDMKAPAKPTP